MSQEDASKVARVAQPPTRIKAFLGLGVTVVLVLAIKLLPRIWSEYEQHQAMRDAAEQVAHEAARDEARKLVAGMRNDVPATSSSVVLDRSGYTITVPEGSTVDPQDKHVDQDHLTLANLPHHTTLVVLMIDTKTRGHAVFDRTVASVKGRLESFTTESAQTFDTATAIRTTSLRGKVKNNEPFVVEVAELSGPERAYVVVAEYPESSAADAPTMLKKALGTLHLKV
jgi:hypothetical protein